MKWLPAVALVASFAFFVSPVGEIVVEKSAEILAQRPVTILAFGDMMLDRAVSESIDVYGPQYPFANIAPLLTGHDIAVANAEGVFTDNYSISVRDHSVLRFTFATGILPVLRALGFTALSQANNHALDFGQAGLQFSKNAMEHNNISPFGDPLNKDPGPLYIGVRNETVAFVGYHQLFASDASSTLAAIAQAHEHGTFIIVYPHWGVEYNLGTTSAQTRLAHEFIDAGADVVLGSHPHVVEPVEIYKEKAIFYSLGNFVFDQRWNDAVSQGLAVEISLTKNQVSYKLIPFAIQNLQPTPTGEESSFVLKR